MVSVLVRGVTSAGGWVCANPLFEKIIFHDAGSFIYEQPQFIKPGINFVILGDEKIIRQIPAFRKVKVIHPMVLCESSIWIK